jgi:hypothetical protein
MIMTPKTLVRFLAGLGVGVALISAMSPAMAQFSADALKDTNQQNKDPFSNPNGSSSGTNGIFDLIHRAVMGQGKSFEEFNAEQSESLDAATAAFREQQQAQLGKSPVVPQTTSPVPAPTSESK